MTDNELIDSIVDFNSTEAFTSLVNRYQKLVYVTCSSLISVAADVDDVVQEVFIELFHSLKSFRGESKLSTWLYRIAVNKSLNHLRRVNREKFLKRLNFWETSNSTDIQIPASHCDDSDYSLNTTENRKILKLAMAKLPEKQRVAFILSKYHDLSYSEIADIMGTSISSVESLLFRAKVNLRKNIAEFL